MQRLIDRDDATQDRDKDLTWAASRPDPLTTGQRAQLTAWMLELEEDQA